jgi:PAS domain-containing protein
MIDILSIHKPFDGLYVPLKITEIYAGGGIWILLFNRLLITLFSDLETLTRLQTFIGSSYVVVMANLLYVFVQRSIANIQRSGQIPRESKARSRSLMDDVLDRSIVDIFVLNKDFRVLWADQGLGRYFGLQRSEIIGKNKR